MGIALRRTGAGVTQQLLNHIEASTPVHEVTRIGITSNDVGRFVGSCYFTARKGGSFEIALPDEADEQVYTKYIYINITSAGRGRIGGAGGTGRVSDWGAVQRDPNKPACWFGEWGRVIDHSHQSLCGFRS